AIRVAQGGTSYQLTGIPDDLATNPIVLQTGETFSFGVRFTPDKIGLERAVIEVTTNDPQHPVLRVGATGTGLDQLMFPHWAQYFVAIEMPNRAGFTPVRALSNDHGNFSFFLPPKQFYHLVVFDPQTGLVAHGYGTTPASGKGIDLTADLVFEASTA